MSVASNSISSRSSRIHPPRHQTTSPHCDTAKDADLAIEAVFEDVEVKKATFAGLAKVMANDAILATNTSYLDPTPL